MTLAVYPSCLEGPPPISRFTSPCLFGKPPSVENEPTTRHPCLKIEENLDGIESHPPSHDTSTPISPIEPGRLDPISHFPGKSSKPLAVSRVIPSITSVIPSTLDLWDDPPSIPVFRFLLHIQEFIYIYICHMSIFQYSWLYKSLGYKSYYIFCNISKPQSQVAK